LRSEDNTRLRVVESSFVIDNTLILNNVLNNKPVIELVSATSVCKN
jgi:hypothetical protein